MRLALSMAALVTVAAAQSTERSLLPADESGHGFDNVIVGDLSPTLVSRYISAAQKVSSLVVGNTQSLQSDAAARPIAVGSHLPAT